MPVLMSVTYLITAVILLGICISIYLWITPYRELVLIREGNVAASLSLGGATIGQAIPIASAIYFTHDLVEMVRWAAIACAMQFILFQIIRKQARGVETGNIALGVVLACLSISTGLLVAACIS